MSTTGTMASMAAASRAPNRGRDSAWRGACAVDTGPHRQAGGRERCRRYVAEGAVAVFAGSIMALGWAAVAAKDERMSGRRAQLERDMSLMSSPLAELARLERADESAKAAAAQAQLLARPIIELRSLLEVLGREVQSGVAISRLRRSDEGIELQVRAADTVACASWVERLQRLPGLESVETVGLKSLAAPAARQGETVVEATVHLRWRGASAHAPRPSPSRQVALESRKRRERSER
jgi:Tfp pilus assembly protein PilN